MERTMFAAPAAVSISRVICSPLRPQPRPRLHSSREERHGQAWRSPVSMTKAGSSMSLGPIGLLASAGFLETAYLTYTKLVCLDYTLARVSRLKNGSNVQYVKVESGLGFCRRGRSRFAWKAPVQVYCPLRIARCSTSHWLPSAAVLMVQFFCYRYMARAEKPLSRWRGLQQSHLPNGASWVCHQCCCRRRHT